MKKYLLAILLFFSSTIITYAQAPVFDEFIYLPVILNNRDAPNPTGCDKANDANNSSNNAQEIINNKVVGCIIDKDDKDWFKFTLDKKYALTITYNFAPTDTNFRIDVYNSNLESIDYQLPWYSYPFIVSTCGNYPGPLESGTYYIKLSDWLGVYEIENYEVNLNLVPCPTLSVIPDTVSAWIYQGYSNALVVGGEIQNDGQLPVSSIKVTVNLFDAQNVLIDTSVVRPYLGAYSWYSGLAPGEKTCFVAMLDNYEGWGHYEFEQPTYNDIEPVLGGIIIHGDTGQDIENDDYRVLGFAKNETVNDLDNLSVVVTIYNPKVIGCKSTSINTNPLPAGESGSFEIEFSDRNIYDETGYRIQPYQY